ncbi:hypothetical protein FZEAL_5176 [Fusarium zealandicum]|uniref:Xylanolytic transcriptional activator regulatory domain-containing protein n=1 Tax=Fusarium zealandicum TaxID=1053134 RepID=A0A8H4UL16_9HYPO|nr:hypothetical protein FZEAL_5176 [Fusarium zealandicum]
MFAPNAVLASCQRRGRDCVYPETRRTQRSERRPSVLSDTSFTPRSTSQQVSAGQSAQPTSASPADLLSENALASPAESRSSFNSIRLLDGKALPLPPIREQLHLVVDYFRHLYPLPEFSFLNEGSITQRCLDGNIEEPLLLALCAVTTLRLGYLKYHPTSSGAWVHRAEAAIWAQIEQPTIFRTQALMLIILYRIETGEFQKAFMLCSIAARGASALRLHYERTDLSPLAQEIRRRLMWCLTMLDMHFSLGLPECELCPYEVIYLKLPCEEENFNFGDSREADANSSLSLDGVREDGLLSRYIQHLTVRRDVMRLKRQLSLSAHAIPQLAMIVDDFRKSLQSTRGQQYSHDVLKRYSRSKWLGRYVASHLSWHQCHCDLSRMFLPGYREAAPEAVVRGLPEAYVTDAAQNCLYHARAIMKILQDLSELNPGLVVAHMDIAICAYHSSRLLLFLSQSPLNPSDSGLTTDLALTQATAVFQLVKRLFTTSPIVNRLTVDFGRLIHLYATGQREPSQESSDTDEHSPTRPPRFARVAKEHQKLGVHSMLRHARFVDDSYNDTESTQSPEMGQSSVISSAHSDHGRPLTNTSSTHASALSPSSSRNSHLNASTSPLEMVNSPAESATVSSGLNLSYGNMFNISSPTAWQDVWGYNEPSTATDGDYF